MKASDHFHYINGRFLTNTDLITVPDGEIPDFIILRSDQKTSPR